jgi:hypothetical protein
MRHRTLGKWHIVGAAFILGAVLSAVPTATAEPRTLYRETFGYCTGTIGKDAAAETNWVGLVSGLPQAKISNLKVFSYGTLDIGSSVNSNPLGLAQGYAFWFKPVFGLTVLTAEFQFDVGMLKNSQALIQYRQRLSGIDIQGQPNKTHLAILIDNVWYISSDFARQARPGYWESAQFSPAALTYGTTTYVPGLGPNLPAVSGAPLPAAGMVRAFGVFMDEVNGRVRLDNFTIKGVIPADGSISGDIQEPDVSLCPPTSPDRNGGGAGPTPPPDEDDGDNSADRLQPTPLPTPSPAPVENHSVVYQFCPVKEQGSGKRLSISSRSRVAILKKISPQTLVDLRDRAMVAVLSQRSMPLGALVNVKRGDYNSNSGVLTLSTRPSAKPSRFRLRGEALKAMRVYLQHAAAPTEVTAPLFLNSTGVEALHTVTKKALCLSGVRTALRVRVAQAKVSLRGL